MSNVLYRKPTNFAMVSYQALQDTRLSWKARGIYAFLVSKASIEGWKFSREALIGASDNDGKTSYDSGIKELKDLGYLTIEPIKGENGDFAGYKWTINDRFPELPVFGNTENQETKRSYIEDKKKVTSNEKTDCSLPPQTIKFNYASNKLIIPDREIFSQWRHRYPDVDVPAELRLIEDWCIANPRKVKPRQRDGTGGLYRTITNWLRREQEKYEATLRIQKARQRVEEGEYNDECAND